MREKTNLTLHPSVKKAALELAESQGRSLSELVERLLEREVEKGRPTHEDNVHQKSQSATAIAASAKKKAFDRGLKRAK